MSVVRDIIISFGGLFLFSGLLTWLNEPGLPQWKHRYSDALNDGRLDPNTKDWEYEELEMKHGPYQDYTALTSRIE